MSEFCCLQMHHCISMVQYVGSRDIEGQRGYLRLIMTLLEPGK